MDSNVGGWGGPDFPDLKSKFDEIENQVNTVGTVHSKLAERQTKLIQQKNELKAQVNEYTDKKVAIDAAEASKPVVKTLKSTVETALTAIKKEIEAIKVANSSLESTQQATTIDSSVLDAWKPLNSLVSRETELFNLRKLENDAYTKKYAGVFKIAEGNRKIYNNLYSELKSLHEKFVRDSQNRSEKDVALITEKITEFNKRYEDIKAKSDEVIKAYNDVVEDDMTKIAKAGGDVGDITISFSPTFIVIVVVLILLLLILHFYFKYRDRRLKLKPVEYEDEDSYDSC